MLPMVPLPVPPEVQPWIGWVFGAIAVGAFVLILVNGIQRLRRMRDERDDDEGGTR